MTEIWTMGEMLVEIMRPQAGISLHEPGEFMGPFPSGAPAIFIDTAARLGHSAGIIGGVADDDFGRCLLDRLEFDKVDLRFVKKTPGGATATAFVSYFEDGSRKFIFHIDGTPAAMGSFPDEARGEKPAFFHVMGCSLMINDGFRAEIFKAVEFFYQAGSRISFDPNIRFELLRGMELMEIIEPVLKRTAILMPGEAELKLIGGNDHLETCVRTLFKSQTLETIVLKRGKAGARIYTNSETIEIPPIKIQEIDPTGAGDSFDAGFLCGLLDGKSLQESGEIAAAAGALNAAAFGPMEGKIGKESIHRLLHG